MAKRVYISPSDQVENKYAWGNTNEHVQCQRIAEAEAAALRRCGVEVQLAKFGTSMAQRCAESNAFGADIHNCVHTNAFNGKVLLCRARKGVRRLPGGLRRPGAADSGDLGEYPGQFPAV